MKIAQNIVESSNSQEHIIKRTLRFSIVLNILLVIFTISVGIITHIQSIVLDGIHSLSDLFSDVLLFLVVPFAYKEKDDDHHYGHSRYEDVLSLVVGILIVGTGLPFLQKAYSSIFLNHPVPQILLNKWAWMITIGTIVSKEFLYHFTMIIGKRINSPMLIANAVHHRSDVFSSCLVLIALIGIYIGMPKLDSYIAIVLAGYLIYAGLKIMFEAINILTDRVPLAQHDIIEKIIRNTEKVYGFHDLRLRQSGPFIMGDVHLEIEGTLTIVESHEIITNVQVSIREQIPNLRYFTIHLDPYKKI